ncbi:glycosyltransferase, family 2 [Campylobacter sputorum subsp. sputorum]|nr:glycosyltransferase family 2 protein [Campylobacter sputorum]KAB0582701.1 glycosyltransferase family 2 protein [Campylobacter sputorum subsp. sputorum]QEL05759.1 glycosyltransferase, family 2 [Campylobacter sputorum subsp. sputorum]
MHFKIIVVISTINLKDYKELVKRMNLQTDCIIINQTNYDKKEKYKFDDFNIKIISVNKKGLSKSRNLGFEYIKDSDIVYFADDNFVFCDNYKQKIVNAYTKFKYLDGICFSVKRGNLLKKLNGKLNYLNSFKIFTPQITFKTNFLMNNNIKFDERFGSGSRFGSGEENILLFECLDKKANIYGSDEVLGIKTDFRPSTWFNGYNRDFLFNRGAIFTRMSKKYSFLLILQFSIRKYKLYSKENIGFFEALKHMLKGRKYFLELDSE